MSNNPQSSPATLQQHTLNKQRLQTATNPVPDPSLLLIRLTRSSLTVSTGRPVQAAAGCSADEGCKAGLGPYLVSLGISCIMLYCRVKLDLSTLLPPHPEEAQLPASLSAASSHQMRIRRHIVMWRTRTRKLNMLVCNNKSRSSLIDQGPLSHAGGWVGGVLGSD